MMACRSNGSAPAIASGTAASGEVIVDGGTSLNDVDLDGVCDEIEIYGCTDDLACNYDYEATEWYSCEYAIEYYNCSGTCLNDVD